MKVKLTPLNIVTAAFLVIAVSLLLEKDVPRSTGTINMTPILTGFSFLIALVSFVSDLIFRKFIPQLKKIWMVELAFILLTIALIIIIKVIFN